MIGIEGTYSISLIRRYFFPWELRQGHLWIYAVYFHSSDERAINWQRLNSFETNTPNSKSVKYPRAAEIALKRIFRGCLSPNSNWFKSQPSEAYANQPPPIRSLQSSVYHRINLHTLFFMWLSSWLNLISISRPTKKYVEFINKTRAACWASSIANHFVPLLSWKSQDGICVIGNNLVTPPIKIVCS